ncbi:zinc dependent phospholipase C family protein [Sphingobacterium lactis]|uniref:S1/P1 Nuclease n=1 Tax=Sphingobacterium lactis TaxID=797291 RepID=A0A1H6C4X7_9SPHI|nr:zinc dependent phospholipase C family protein [Sphingobacterium lactis]SEG67685.1 hypothetical protein SAMN05421877_11329 [Sphingobacterium lactis]
MKKVYLIGIILLCPFFLAAWGFHVHRLINLNAIYTLPQPLNIFFKRYSNQIREMAINADKRVYVDPDEAVRHYINLDLHSLPTDSLMVPWYKIKKRTDQQQILQKGILPWQIDLTYQKLVSAYKQYNTRAILRHASDLGHYIADAHVPLHTTSNYNGHLTGQPGIHALWETRIPELFSKDYNFLVGSASYIDDIKSYSWQTILDSHAALDSVLLLEKRLSEQIPSYQQKAYHQRGNTINYSYSNFYVHAYHQRMNGLVERQMRKSVHALGSMWFSAWVDAGQPNIHLSPKIPQTMDTVSVKHLNTRLKREEWH